ncbi:general substrate transporter [Podospora appendiculata]|uniref:General substrate transporter n=1 Tax=Podospora appendiculata TaxID=314037 RepID=A0AAE0XET3_9PEZI|nr:general substrate transporter [Podospora appendiculata]
MTFRNAIKADKHLIWYSLGFSGTIIMEGYGFALITYLFSFPVFNKKYGEFDDVKQDYELRYIWKALLPLVAQFGSLIGVFLCSFLVSKFGYKWATMLMLVLLAATICVTFFAETVQMLSVGFLLQGIPWGVFQVASPGYASEIASLQLRPILTTWTNLCWVIGQLMASAIVKGFQKYPGDLSFRIPFALQWVFIVLLMINVFLAPESPYWHLQKKKGTNQANDARKAIKKIVRKGDPQKVEAKLALMQHAIHQERKKQAPDAPGFKGKLGRFVGMFMGVDARRTEIACMAWLIQSMCGSSIIPWAPKLFEGAGLDPSQALSVNIALPAAGILGTLGSWGLMRKWGHRAIYFWGLLVMALLLTGCGLASLAPDSIAGWAAGGILAAFTLVYDLTIGPVCYSIVSEMPSIRRRAQTLSAARGTYLLAGLINHFLTPKMVGSDGDSWNWGPKTGFLYAGICAISAVYTFYRIPETNEISTRELDILFQHKVKSREFCSQRAKDLDEVERREEEAEEMRRSDSTGSAALQPKNA